MSSIAKKIFLFSSWAFVQVVTPEYSHTKEQTVFEGYYKILAGKKHIGFVINRFRIDQKSKSIRSTYYIRTNSIGGNITESLNAYANDKFRPISYQFTQTSGNKALIVDAQFKPTRASKGKGVTGSVMTATISNGTKSRKVQKTLGKNDFLSTFLGYLMHNNGISTDKRYNYAAVAEEEASLLKGDVYIEKKTETYKGKEVFKLRNVFKKSKFISYMTINGEILGTYSPAQGISTELVAAPKEATTGITFNVNHLQKLFGQVPLGKRNILSTPAKK